MTSFDKRMANRANAAKSTGPKTPEGKRISRRNALSHGFTATTLLLEGEDKEMFAALRLGLMEELEPESILEMEMADRLIGLVWRSRRIATFEAAILAWMGHWSGEFYEFSDYEKTRKGVTERIQTFHQGLEFDRNKRSEETNQKLLLGRLLHEEMNHNLIAKLSRYESHLLTQLRRTYRDLVDRQVWRRRQEAIDDARRRTDELLAAEANSETPLPCAVAPPLPEYQEEHRPPAPAPRPRVSLL